MKDKSYIFTHIQKTAGTSMRDEVIFPNFKEEERQKFMGGFGIKKLITSNTRHIKIFSGHMPYGIHHFIKQDCDYLTFLREPIERAISHYNFIKYPRGNNRYAAIHKKYSIVEIFDNTSSLNPFKSILVDNMQTRYLAGYLYYGLPKNSSLLLKKAKYNLENNYRSFGIKENYSDSIQLISNEFGWKHQADNTRKKQTLNKDIVSDSDLISLKDNHRLDIELYDFALDLFNKRIG